MFRGLSARLVVSHVAVALLGVALVTYGSSLLFARSHSRSIEQRLISTAESLAHNVAGPLAGKDRATIALIVNTAGRVIAGRVCVLDAEGFSLIATSDVPPTDGHRHEEFVRDAARGESSLDVVDVECSGLTYTVTVPILHPATSDTIGVLLLHAPTQDYELTPFLQRTLTLVAGLAAALVAVLLAALVAHSLAHPIERITESARALAEGDFERRIDPRGPAEVRSLAGALNWASSELQQAFQTLASERARLADLLASMSEGVVGVDGAGRVVEANEPARRLLALTGEPIVGAELSELVPKAETRAALAHGTGAECLAVGNRLLRIQAATLAGGEGFVAVVSDVTESERIEKMREDFIANASHQLRSPLMSIRGYLQAIVDGAAESDEERARCVDVALEQVALLARRTDKLLELSKLQAREGPADPREVRLDELAARACEHIRPQAEARGVRVELHRPEQPAWVSGDADQVLEAVHNILDNAIRHSPRGGTVVVTAEQVDGEARVSIADNGPGFVETDESLFWKRFYSGQQNGAAGLGLAITQEIVRAHSGRVWATANPEGGAIFGFGLPSHEPTGIPDATE